MPYFNDTSDCLNLSTLLRRQSVNRTFFDASLQSHLDSLDVFLCTGNWGDVQFYCEHPYIDVPMTVLMKFAMYEQGVRRESGQERAERIAGRPGVVATPTSEVKVAVPVPLVAA